MNINYQPESCPQCGVNFQRYYDVVKEDFEDKHIVKLVKVRSTARYKGIVKGLIIGLLVSTLLVTLSRQPPRQPLVEHMRLFFSQNSYFVALLYIMVILLFILINTVSEVNSREEKKMWEQFLQERSEADYLQPIP